MDVPKLEKLHSQKAARAFGCDLGPLLAADATDAELQEIRADGETMMEIAVAIDEIMRKRRSKRKPPTATIDFHGNDGGVVAKAVPLANGGFDPKRVAAAVIDSADKHLADHVEAMRTPDNPLCLPDEPGGPGELHYNAGD